MIYTEKAAFEILLPLLETIQGLDKLLNSSDIMYSVMAEYHFGSVKTRRVLL